MSDGPMHPTLARGIVDICILSCSGAFLVRAEDHKAKDAREGVLHGPYELRSVFKDKCDLQMHPILSDLAAVIHKHFLILNPSRLDVLERFDRAGHSRLHGVLESLG
jgi:hypothetical protein